MPEENKLNESINDLKSFQEKLKDASTKTADVKNGTATPEEEQQEPAYRIYNAITETSIQILQMPTFVDGFNQIADKLGEDVAKRLAEMMVVAMSHSAHSAIVYYDELLKEELTKQFDNYGKSLNDVIGDLNGQRGAMNVFKERLGNIENKLQVEDITSKH